MEGEEITVRSSVSPFSFSGYVAGSGLASPSSCSQPTSKLYSAKDAAVGGHETDIKKAPFGRAIISFEQSALTYLI